MPASAPADQASIRSGPGPGARLVGVFLIALMVVGSLMLWIGAPVFWLWVGSQLQQGSQPTLGPYVLVLVGVIVSMVIIGKLLSRLDHIYSRVTHGDAKVRVRLPWMRSMRGERSSGRPTRVVDIVMVASVSAAGLVFGIWFFVFAGSSLPH